MRYKVLDGDDWKNGMGEEECLANKVRAREVEREN